MKRQTIRWFCWTWLLLANAALLGQEDPYGVDKVRFHNCNPSLVITRTAETWPKLAASLGITDEQQVKIAALRTAAVADLQAICGESVAVSDLDFATIMQSLSYKQLSMNQQAAVQVLLKELNDDCKLVLSRSQVIELSKFDLKEGLAVLLLDSPMVQVLEISNDQQQQIRAGIRDYVTFAADEDKRMRLAAREDFQSCLKEKQWRRLQQLVGEAFWNDYPTKFRIQIDYLIKRYRNPVPAELTLEGGPDVKFGTVDLKISPSSEDATKISWDVLAPVPDGTLQTIPGVCVQQRRRGGWELVEGTWTLGSGSYGSDMKFVLHGEQELRRGRYRLICGVAARASEIAEQHRVSCSQLHILPFQINKELTVGELEEQTVSGRKLDPFFVELLREEDSRKLSIATTSEVFPFLVADFEGVCDLLEATAEQKRQLREMMSRIRQDLEKDSWQLPGEASLDLTAMMFGPEMAKLDQDRKQDFYRWKSNYDKELRALLVNRQLAVIKQLRSYPGCLPEMLLSEPWGDLLEISDSQRNQIRQVSREWALEAEQSLAEIHRRSWRLFKDAVTEQQWNQLCRIYDEEMVKSCSKTMPMDWHLWYYWQFVDAK